MRAILGNLARLTRFGGRQTRATFWPYSGLVVGLSVAIMFAGMFSEMFASVGRMEEFARANPDQATVTRGPGSYSITVEGHHPELMPDMSVISVALGLAFAVAIVLLAAAVTRRLHDTGKPGFWGLLPVPFIITSTVVMQRLFSAAEPDMGMFGLMFLSNALYMLALLALVVLLAQPTQAGANRFGPQEAGV